MKSSAIPYKFTTPWGLDASAPNYITTPIPAVSVGAAAGQDLGFPPITAENPLSGGIPPNINDINGALNYETLWSRWFQAGAPVGYDSAFSSAIGGYPKGAVLSAASFGAFWISTVDDNTSDPDTGGANWNSFSTAHGFAAFAASQSFTVPSGVFNIFSEVFGGGGSGGGVGASGSAAGGGGAGGMSKQYCSVTPGTAITITVGLGGAPGGSGGGNNGGTSSFGSYNGATGGQGGGGAGAQGGVGGIGTGSGLNGSGAPGNPGVTGLSGALLGGTGASSVWGGGGLESPGAGINATGYASGGSGAGGAGAANGGAGAGGLVILTW